MAGLNIIWNTPKQVSGQCKNWVPGRKPKELNPGICASLRGSSLRYEKTSKKIVTSKVLKADKIDTVSIGGIQKAAAQKHRLNQGVKWKRFSGKMNTAWALKE